LQPAPASEPESNGQDLELPRARADRLHLVLESVHLVFDGSEAQQQFVGTHVDNLRCARR
jgi:hypothetical protein